MRVLIVLFLALPLTAIAEGLSFDSAWSRATPPGARTAAVYGVLSNNGNEPLTLAEISTGAAKMAHLHTTSMEGGMMKMRQADAVVLAPGEQLVLEPGGFHIMLMQLGAPLAEGDEFDVEIGTSEGERIEVSVPVGSVGQMGPP